MLQIHYVRTVEQQNLFPTDTTLNLVPSFKYVYDSSGAPTSLPAADACRVRPLSSLDMPDLTVTAAVCFAHNIASANPRQSTVCWIY